MVRTTTDDPTTRTEAVNDVADALQSVGYTAAAHPSIGVVNVFDPSDASAMYEHVDAALPDSLVIDVRMTSSTKFQIDPDAKGRLADN